MRLSKKYCLFLAIIIVYVVFNLHQSINLNFYHDQEPSEIPWGNYYFKRLDSTEICDQAIWRWNNSTILIVPFKKFLDISVLKSCIFDDGSKWKFALVIPDQLHRKVKNAISLNRVGILVDLLIKYDWLMAIAGENLVLNDGEKPACTMKRKKWTIELSENYSEFQDGSKSISIGSVACYPCDLLPDIFLIKLSHVFDQANRSINLTELQSSARIPLFLGIDHRSAYCPSVRIINQNFDISSIRLTCNNLRMIWGGNFLLIPPKIGVYRLILHQSINRSIEHWLGCTWAKRAFDVGLPVHCSNWVRQTLFDMADVLDKLKVDYRIVDGTLLGAIRNSDVIPWTPDADFLINPTLSIGKFRRRIWRRLPELSQYRHSYMDRSGDEHDAHMPPLRAFKTCPVRLTNSGMNSTEIDDSSRTELIDGILRSSFEIDAVFSHHSWKSSGYADLYYPYIYRFISRDCSHYLHKDHFELVTIAGRQFKTVVNPVGFHLQCIYGNDWKTPPNFVNEWKMFY